MVMGSIPLFFEAIPRNIASVRFSTVFCAVLLLMVLLNQCGEAAGGCSIDECSSRYRRSTRRLDREQENNPSADLTSKRCRVVKKLHRCLHRIRRVCRGNLLYHSIKHINDMDREKYNCPRKPTLLSPTNLPSSSEPVKVNTSTITITTTSLGSPRDGDVCRYLGSSPKRHCGMFGDPHLRTFSDIFNTCRVEGTWPLIDNDYMVVMVTNVPVEEGSPATVPTKITVLIKAAGQCAGQRHYVASSEQLPGAFTDGSSLAGSVEVVETEPGNRVEIRAEFIGTTVIIRRVSRYLTFAIRIPEEFVNGVTSHTQLCVEGCPKDHQLAPIQKMQSSETKQRHNVKNEFSAIDPSVSPNFETNHDKMKPDEEPELPTEVLYFTEKEAREKCKQILLDLPVEEEADSEEEEEQSTDSSKTAKKSFKSLSSLSSSAFSSLVSSPIENPTGNKHHKMAAAHRPSSDVLHSSSKRTRGSKSRRSRAKSRSKRSIQSKTSTDRKPCPTEKDVSKNSNFYFESCVFDLITTGDIDFTLAAKAALDDVRRTHVMGSDAPGTSLEVVRLWEPISREDAKCPEPDGKDSGDRDDPGGSASSAIVSHLTLIICVFFSCVYVNAASLSFSSVLSTVNLVERKKEEKYFKFERNDFHTTKLILNETS